MGFIPLGNVGDGLRDPYGISFDRIRGGIITAQQLIIAGGTDGVMRSQNYNGTDTGWAIFGDGSAKFFGLLTIGANAVVLGDIYSSVWDGTIPADLSSGLDTGATAGYYLDSSAGALQLVGDLVVGGPQGDYLLLDASDWATTTGIKWFRNSGEVARVFATDSVFHLQNKVTDGGPRWAPAPSNGRANMRRRGRRSELRAAASGLRVHQRGRLPCDRSRRRPHRVHPSPHSS